MEARTLEYQVKHADEARGAVEEARRSLHARREDAQLRPNEAARLIAARAVTLELRGLDELETRLHLVEQAVAARIVAEPDSKNYRVLRLAE
jgi:hypothetical protein